ncbi:MotA/TolQ/ExbB proton channel family protein [Mucisphaera sp.]|uniref:MotA/TolQ/ExbB proton channel family protein n=1 Tax=Mucisphaera sp. TaxID=2913024 RepID=UPI003D10A9FA
MNTKHLLLTLALALATAIPAWAQDADTTEPTQPIQVDAAQTDTAQASDPAEADTVPAPDQQAADEPAPQLDQTQAQPAEPRTPTFAEVSQTVEAQLNAAVEELDTLREQIAAEKIPLNRTISQLESQIVDLRQELQAASRQLDSRNLALANLRTTIAARQDEARYLGNLLAEYLRNLEPRLHIAELQRYADSLEQARLAPENSNLTELQRFQTQLAAIGQSVERLFGLLGGITFNGTAADAEGNIKPGDFLVVGPEVLFLSEDGSLVGTADQRLGSLEPTITPFENPEAANAAASLVAKGTGTMPFDPTLGNAHAIAQAQDTFLEHVWKGGPVMIPITLLAAVALLIALYKWRVLAMTPNPSRKKLDPLLRAVAAKDKTLAATEAKKIRGPIGEMLQAGADHLGEPRELIEEIMYEKVLSNTVQLQRLLPFISICAAAAPLLGLLGTVTGIINTFEMITIFGTGDPEALSGGISEALITTKFGLIVAIPALLLYAYLSRMARGIIDSMTQAGVVFMNQIAKSQTTQTPPPTEKTKTEDKPQKEAA